ncbi:hypothetical protein ACPUVO_10240 [Pseudocolwellia sp. HL-MZ19]|uniref:hypothetical protein n=1 Tax=Pseudocolwellia sp. HL-MZ19 TaxID=3400846 RepID=UPI003CE76A81
MEAINKLELHYYFDDDSHDINAITRNKCEAELRADEDDNAQIELISPVLKDGNYKWKGIYKDQIISFYMYDQKYKILGRKRPSFKTSSVDRY